MTLWLSAAWDVNILYKGLFLIKDNTKTNEHKEKDIFSTDTSLLSFKLPILLIHTHTHTHLWQPIRQRRSKACTLWYLLDFQFLTQNSSRGDSFKYLLRLIKIKSMLYTAFFYLGKKYLSCLKKKANATTAQHFCFHFTANAYENRLVNTNNVRVCRVPC